MRILPFLLLLLAKALPGQRNGKGYAVFFYATQFLPETDADDLRPKMAVFRQASQTKNTFSST